MKKLILILLLCNISLATVNSVHDPARGTGDGSATAFSFDFPIKTTTELVVVLRNISTGAEYSMEEDTHYTVSATNNDYIVGPGGTVTSIGSPDASISHPFSSSYEVVMYWVPDMTQDYNANASNRINTTELENSLDELYRMDQYLYNLVLGAFRVPISDPNIGSEYSLERNPSVTSSRYVALDSSNTPSLVEATTGINLDPTWEEMLTGDETDAERRTWKDDINLNYSVNVMDYAGGADINDGVTDATAAIQAAIDDVNSAGGGLVDLPLGTYVISSALTPGDYVVIRGSGYNTTLDVAVDVNCFEFGHADNYTRRPVFYNFRIIGDSATSSHAFRVKSGTNNNVVDMHIEQMTIDSEIGGMYVEAGADITKMQWVNSRVTQSNTQAFYAEGGSGTELNNLHFESTWFDAHDVNAIYANNALYASFEDCIFESIRGKYSVYLKGGIVDFINCLFFNNGNSGPPNITDGAEVYLVDGSNTTINFTRCRFRQPDDRAETWYGIISVEPEINLNVHECLIDIEDSNYVAFCFDNTSTGATNIDISNNLTYGDKPLFTTARYRSQRIYNNSGTNFTAGGDPNAFGLTDVYVTEYTTDATQTTIWGGQSIGPSSVFPDANSLVTYKAIVTAKGENNEVYLSQENIAIIHLEETSANVYDLEIIGGLKTNYIPPGSLDVDWGLSNDVSSTAGVKLDVTGQVGYNIQWTARITPLGARTPSTF